MNWQVAELLQSLELDTLRLASQRLALPIFRMDRLACSWRRFRPSTDSATVRSVTCNTVSLQDHAEAGCAKAGTAQFFRMDRNSLYTPWSRDVHSLFLQG